MAKLNGTAKWIGLIMTFLAIFASVVVAFTLTQAKTCELEKCIEVNKTVIKAIDSQAEENER